MAHGFCLLQFCERTGNAYLRKKTNAIMRDGHLGPAHRIDAILGSVDLELEEGRSNYTRRIIPSNLGVYEFLPSVQESREERGKQNEQPAKLQPRETHTDFVLSDGTVARMRDNTLAAKTSVVYGAWCHLVLHR